jgi:hypothetical protein
MGGRHSTIRTLASETGLSRHAEAAGARIGNIVDTCLPPVAVRSARESGGEAGPEHTPRPPASEESGS